MNNSDTQFNFGMIGLGTMGRSLLLNMGDHGVKGAGYDQDAAKGLLLEQEDKHGNLKGFSNITEFVNSLQTPRAIMMLVPAGKIVDNVIEELLPMLTKGDILIDGGNSHYLDTNRRVEYLETKGLHFFGMGVSGGEGRCQTWTKYDAGRRQNSIYNNATHFGGHCRKSKWRTLCNLYWFRSLRAFCKNGTQWY